MRRNLVPLLGKAVIATGHHATRQHEDGIRRSCMTKCEIQLWDQHKTYKQNRRNPVLAKTDHLWAIHNTKEIHAKYPTFAYDAYVLPLYKKGTCFGYIERYKRSNGTDDIGLRPVPYVDYYQITREMLPTLVQDRDWSRIIRAIDDLYAAGSGLFLSGNKVTPAEAKQKVMTFRREAERHLTASPAIDQIPALSDPFPIRLVSRTTEELLADISLPDSKAADGPGKSFPWALPT